MENLKQLRLINNYTQKEIDNILGFSESAISQIEAGKRQISQKNYERLLDLYKFTPKDKIDRLYDVIRFLYSNPNNQMEMEEMDKIYKM